MITGLFSSVLFCSQVFGDFAIIFLFLILTLIRILVAENTLYTVPIKEKSVELLGSVHESESENESVSRSVLSDFL